MKFISLKWKISGVLIISNLLLGLLIVFIVNKTVSESLEKELIERGRTIAVNLSSFSAELILAQDEIGLKQLITGDLNFESVEYILIHDSEGRILADTYNGQVPDVLKGKSFEGRTIDEKPELIQLQDNDLSCYDITGPVQDGYLGYIRVGMKKAYVDETVRTTNFIVILTILSITFIGIVIVIFLANQIIKPILYLTKKADDISQGNLDEKIFVKTNDEIQSLGEALERLRESVKIALDRLKKRQTLRI
ncbi:MAG: HAMP domain-containing protein [Calditrichaceae bacterium]